MDLKENVAEGLRSIKANSLRAIITAAIIAFGIMALVGILTTIDGIKSSVDSSFASLGVNTFDILVENNRGRRGGIQTKPLPPIYYRQAKSFKEDFANQKIQGVTLYTGVAGAAEIKYGSIKTNPNTQVTGIDENYLEIKGYTMQNGRGLNEVDLQLSSNAVVIGSELAKTLFPKESPLGKEISVLNSKYQVVGVLEKKGSITGGGEDRAVFMPLTTARQYDINGRFSYSITTAVQNVEDLDYVVGEATGVMRIIRGDAVGNEDSFTVERADSFLEDIEDITNKLRLGGIGISFITLLGASIALMNIMMVSVTERTREIGVRKALGASPQKIRLQFLIEAIVICILGGLAGIFLGILMGNVVANFIGDDVRFIVPWLLIFVGLVVCVSVGLLSGFLPAVKASKLDPIESLRYE